jgi:DNA-binding MarR family transcriptional regulator
MNMNDNPGFLLHKIGAMMEHISDKVLFEEFGIGFSQFKILFALEHHDGIRQKDIAGFLGQTEASVSRQIKLLVSAKLVSVTKGVDDKKKHLITPTTRGRQIASDAFSLLNVHYTPVLSVLSPHDQLELAKKLSKVHEALEASCNIYLPRKK